MRRGDIEGHECFNCIWMSMGINDPKGSGFCYSECDFVDPEGSYAFWQHSIRDNRLKTPEQVLTRQVAELDKEVEG
jgi:hypothetical protein